MSILVIDDEFESRTLLTDVLSSEGFGVRTESARRLALASVAIERPELILLDIRMPDTDAFEVCRRLKEGLATGDIPVIILSASGESSDRVKGLRMGAADFITTPFQKEELLARVRTHLELSRLRLYLEKRDASRTAQLCESEERFRAIADAAPVLIWISGVDKLCTFVNQRWLDFTGRTMDDEIGDGWTDCVHPDDLEGCVAKYDSSFDARGGFEMEYRLRRSDGEYRWVVDRGVPCFSPDGLFSGYIGSCLDITDLRHTQERILRSQKLESLGVMAAGVAHDFGNLLGTIVAEADLALSEMRTDAPGRESVQNIAAVALKASEIAKMLMASAGSRNARDVFGPVNLSTEVEQMLRLLKVAISKRAVVRTSLAKDLPPVRGNVSQIHQVIMNIVTNASDALADKQGTITVSTDVVHLAGGPANQTLSILDGDYVRLKVSDTGCGMTAGTRARMFDQFFTTKSEGRGLGLAAVDGIVRSHEGAINVESVPGQGSTFEILFPCVAAPTAVSAVVSAASYFDSPERPPWQGCSS